MYPPATQKDDSSKKNKMRLKLLLSFFLIALVSIGSVVIAARRANAREVRSFMFGGGMYGLGGMATVWKAITRRTAHGRGRRRCWTPPCTGAVKARARAV